MGAACLEVYAALKIIITVIKSGVGEKEIGSSRACVLFMNGTSYLEFPQRVWASMAYRKRLWHCRTLQSNWGVTWLLVDLMMQVTCCLTAVAKQQQSLVQMEQPGLQRAAAPSKLKTVCPEPVSSCYPTAAKCLSPQQPGRIVRSRRSCAYNV